MTIKETLGNIIDWKKDISLDAIDRSMNKISASVIINIWRHQMNELRRIVDTILKLSLSALIVTKNLY